MLERNDRIGGCIRTEEITAPGFVHDVMATTFVLFITSPALRRLAPISAGTGSNSATPPRRPACCCPTAATLVSAHGPRRQHRRLQRVAPARATSYGRRCRRDRDAMPACSSACSAARCGRYPTFKLLVGEAWRRGPRGLAAFLGEALTPARGWLETRYQSERRARSGRPGCCMPASARRRLLRPDRQGHRLRAGGGRRAGRQGRREEPARGLRGADQGAGRRDPHRRRRGLDHRGRRPRHRRAARLRRDDRARRRA